VVEKSLDGYVKALNATSLKSQADVLMLAAQLELGAINAYRGVIPSFKDNKLGQVAARLAADGQCNSRFCAESADCFMGLNAVASEAAR
jgi:hypothetical protein